MKLAEEKGRQLRPTFAARLAANVGNVNPWSFAHQISSNTISPLGACLPLMSIEEPMDWRAFPSSVIILNRASLGFELHKILFKGVRHS